MQSYIEKYPVIANERSVPENENSKYQNPCLGCPVLAVTRLIRVHYEEDDKADEKGAQKSRN